MSVFKKAVTGFNHNIKHKGKLYHVQTEDSGVNNPHIITHLFVGGNIAGEEDKSPRLRIAEEGSLPRSQLLAGAAVNDACTHNPLYPFSTLTSFRREARGALRFQPVAHRSRSVLVGERPHAQAIPHALVAEIGFLNRLHQFP